MKLKAKLTNSRMGAFCVFVAVVFQAPAAYAIKKCQDAEGKWHYGDVAVAECENSKVTTLNNQGFIEGEQAAPKSKEQLEAEQMAAAKEQAEKDKAKRELDERNRILSVYQTEADIDRQLDNQIYSVNSNIAVHNVYLKGMREKVVRLEEKKKSVKGQQLKKTQAEIDTARLKIKESEEQLETLEDQLDTIKERFAREKELFRSLKSDNAS